MGTILPDSAPRSLAQLARALQTCRRCPLYRDATQGVPGEGPSRARLMLVGEQPGNDEDLAGKTFVGPAGQMLDKALAAAGIERADVYVTNAVKHFKFARRGKRRLHERPNAHEIERCRWWIGYERRLVRPKLIVALGATAARSILESAVTISKLRGEVRELSEGGRVLVTVHPSYLLRIPDARAKAAAFKDFVRDLRAAQAFIG